MTILNETYMIFLIIFLLSFFQIFTLILHIFSQLLSTYTLLYIFFKVCKISNCIKFSLYRYCFKISFGVNRTIRFSNFYKL